MKSTGSLGSTVVAMVLLLLNALLLRLYIVQHFDSASSNKLDQMDLGKKF